MRIAIFEKWNVNLALYKFLLGYKYAVYITDEIETCKVNAELTMKY